MGLTSAVFAASALGADPLPVRAAAQEQAADRLQQVFGTYRGEHVLADESTNNPSATYTNIEAKLREASALMPMRLDLRFGIASVLLSQALQTNSQFEVKMTEALQAYQDIRKLDANGFQASILYAAYTRALGQTNESESTVVQLLQDHPQQTGAYLERFRRIERNLQILPNTNPQSVMATGREHAIVVLGAGLVTNGTMKAKLSDRLQQGLVLARLNPDSPIIVTGGNAISGITEAYAMGVWFAKQGVSTNRIYLEDQAKDTAGNAICCCPIFRKLGITRVTLVTSASHIRRALADFEEASRGRGLYLDFGHLASSDEPTVDERRERVATYRDVMRISGLWAYPGIQR